MGGCIIATGGMDASDYSIIVITVVSHVASL